MKNFLNTKIQKSEGITLIALVITVIVLVILATVTFNLANILLINKAKGASNELKNETTREQLETNNVSTLVDNIINSASH